MEAMRKAFLKIPHWVNSITARKYNSSEMATNYKRYDKPNSLARRLKSKKCEVCGTITDELHMHHVKRLKDLTGRNEFELMMMAKRRKSLALCPECFDKAHE